MRIATLMDVLGVVLILNIVVVVVVGVTRVMLCTLRGRAKILSRMTASVLVHEPGLMPPRLTN